MSKQPTITTISTGFYSTSALNTNFENIRDQFDNTLSLDGSTPNAMSADFDLNSQDILNGRYVYSQRLYLNGVRVTAPEANITWDGEWATSTSYAVDQLVRNEGTVYICIVDHTSGTFSTDLSSAYWETFAAKGSAGEGSGDMLAANNLSDVVTPDTALANLGGGTVGIAIFKDTTAAAVRTELDVQQQDDILDDLAGLTQATDKIPYFDSATTASSLDFVDEDDMSSDSATALASQQSTKAYVDGKTTTWETEQATTSGTDFDFTVSSTAREITVHFCGNSLDSGGYFLVQLIVSASPITSGYNSGASSSGSDSTRTDGFHVFRSVSSHTSGGRMDIARVGSGAWAASHSVNISGAESNGGGFITGVGTVTGVRVTRSSGNFDAGILNISYR